MVRPVIWIALTCSTLLVACGEPHKVLGNLCGQPECEYDELACGFLPEPNAAYHVTYLNKAKVEPLAMLEISLWYLDDVSQFTLPFPDPGGRIQLSTSSSVFLEFLQAVNLERLSVKEGGLEDGATLHGGLVGSTLGGSRVSVDFDCTLDQIVD